MEAIKSHSCYFSNAKLLVYDKGNIFVITLSKMSFTTVQQVNLSDIAIKRRLDMRTYVLYSLMRYEGCYHHYIV